MLRAGPGAALAGRAGVGLTAAGPPLEMLSPHPRGFVLCVTDGPNVHLREWTKEEDQISAVRPGRCLAPWSRDAGGQVWGGVSVMPPQ